MDDTLLILLIAIEMIFDAVVVAWLAARKTVPKLEQYLESDRAGKYYDKVADRAVIRISPEIDKIRQSIPSSSSLTDALSSSHASLGILQQQLQGSMEKSSLKLSEISEELLEQIDARISEIPDPTAQLDQVLQLRMNELVTVLKTELSASIDAKLRSYDAVKTKQLKAGLEQFGIQLNETSDAIEGELMANAAEGVDPIQQAMMGLATWQPPKKWANDNPLPAMLIQSGKVQALQQIQQMIPTKTGLNKAVGISDKSGIFG